MYVVIVVLTMLVLPVASVIGEHVFVPKQSLIVLVGRWFVFWAVGVRLGLAGIRQVVQPGFTAKQIFHISGNEVLPLVRELGTANAATALVGLLSIVYPAFVLPTAISAGIFYAAAGATHLAERDRSLNENVAMSSDLFIAAVLATVVVVKMTAR